LFSIPEVNPHGPAAHWQRILDWSLTSAPRILLILLATWIALKVARKLSTHLIDFIVGKNDDVEFQKRAQTLVGIARYIMILGISIIATLTILRELGIEIGPILAAAGIMGLAVGFGAQSLVKDVISGFFILLDDQIRVGDVVEIAGKSGLVEKVNLRVTVLRDVAGSVHYVPNGTIAVVTNMTKDYSRYILDVGVATEMWRGDRGDQRHREEMPTTGLQDDMLTPRGPGPGCLYRSAVGIRARTTTRPTPWAWAGVQPALKKRFDSGDRDPLPPHDPYMGQDKQGGARAARRQLKPTHPNAGEETLRMKPRIAALAALALLLPGRHPRPWAALADAVREHTLANGMKLLMVERKSSPTVAAWIAFKVGSAHEGSGERGIAHLLEHMLFKGTQTLGTNNYKAEKPLLEKIEATAQRLLEEKAKGPAGEPALIARLEEALAALEREAAAYVVKDEFSSLYARHGGFGYNAFTSRDSTAYLINLPANKLALWAAIESDRMRYPVLREFYSERSVVMEERRAPWDPPDGLFWESFSSPRPTGPPIRPAVTADVRHRAAQPYQAIPLLAPHFLRPPATPCDVVGRHRPAAGRGPGGAPLRRLPSPVPVPPSPWWSRSSRGSVRTEIRTRQSRGSSWGFHKPASPIPWRGLRRHGHDPGGR
jgi:hypothetical protein